MVGEEGPMERNEVLVMREKLPVEEDVVKVGEEIPVVEKMKMVEKKVEKTTEHTNQVK